jgi:hypothetical protein
VERLTGARRHLKMALRGVRAWRLGGDLLENLRFRLKLRHVRAVQQLLEDSTDTLEDFTTLLPPGDVAAAAAAEARRAFAAAHANLLAQLAEASTLGLSEGVRQAREPYGEQVQRLLIAPLFEWALASSDAALRNVGLQRTTVCQLLHGMTPLLLNLQTRQFERDRTADSESLPPKALVQYLALIARLGQLARDLWQWRML